MEAQYGILKGIPAAPGLAQGKIVIVANQALAIPDHAIDDVEGEISRLEKARQIAKSEILELKETVKSGSASNEAEIFEAHSMIIDDLSLIQIANKDISCGKNAEAAWMKAIEFFAQQMEAIPDETLASRALDIRDVGRRVLQHLLGVENDAAQLETPAIIVGRDLSPSDTVSLDKKLVLAFCTAEGGPTSHTAILAKAFGLPAVVGLGEDLLDIPAGTYIMVDGDAGEVTIAPDEAQISSFSQRQNEADRTRRVALKAAFEPAVTKDGVHVEIVANIGGVEDAQFANENGAEGVGLFRTEFLYLDRRALPTEDEQITAYREIFNHFEEQPVVVRTLDIGGDKEIPYLNFPKELNPFLGWRGIRMLDGRDDIFRVQIRSLLQAGVGVDLRIMVPMVALKEEILAVRGILDEERTKLQKEGKPVAERVQFGIMVEVPSVAILSDRIAELIDFFSIGTNDLTQYTLAVDRTNSQVARLASAFHPAVLHLIQRTIQSAHAVGKWVGLCGEFAGEPLAVAILLGLGLDEFSMAPASIPVIKQLIRKLSLSDCQSMADKALTLSTAGEVEAFAKDYLADLGIEQ
ncbi:MAG: phosphoenolpyruvate--protein phosphotransferase [Chloroflexota bacterium]